MPTFVSPNLSASTNANFNELESTCIPSMRVTGVRRSSFVRELVEVFMVAGLPDSEMTAIKVTIMRPNSRGRLGDSSNGCQRLIGIGPRAVPENKLKILR